VKIIAVMGSKNSGKTTVAEFLVERFVRDGFRVAAAKHIHHEFTIDTEGKDTWRLSRKGARIVASISPNELAVLFYAVESWDSSFERLVRMIEGEVDVLIAEGFHMLLGGDERVYKILTVKSPEDLGTFLPRLKEPILTVVNNAGTRLDLPDTKVYTPPLTEDFYRHVRQGMGLQ